jgi:hypothetical protein
MASGFFGSLWGRLARFFGFGADKPPPHQAEIEDLSFDWIAVFTTGPEPNVEAVRYEMVPGTMDVMYLAHGKWPRRIYRYWNITTAEAYELITTDKPGTWCWSHLRVRGSQRSCRKPYLQIG